MFLKTFQQLNLLINLIKDSSRDPRLQKINTLCRYLFQQNVWSSLTFESTWPKSCESLVVLFISYLCLRSAKWNNSTIWSLTTFVLFTVIFCNYRYLKVDLAVSNVLHSIWIHTQENQRIKKPFSIEKRRKPPAREMFVFFSKKETLI